MGVGGELTPGTPFEGGYYAGRIMVDGQAYALVVAPKTQGGEAVSLIWKTTHTGTVGTASRNDGWANTQDMIQAGSVNHPAAAFCRGLNINGYDDWYLPSPDELEILYRVFKPTTTNNNSGYGANPSAIPPTENYTTSNPSQTNVEVFKERGVEAFQASYYWASRQNAAASSYGLNFSNGAQVTLTKSNGRSVRAVRRVAI